MKEGIRFSFRLSSLLIQEWQGNFLHNCACVGHGVGNWTLRESQTFLLLFLFWMLSLPGRKIYEILYCQHRNNTNFPSSPLVPYALVVQ